MSSFSGTTLLLNVTDHTTASFESDPPYEFGWAKSGTIALQCDNWANTDNSLQIDVYWGSHIKGLLATNANIVWVRDTNLTLTLTGAAGTTTEVAGVLQVPEVKGRYMKLVCTLAGTSKEVDAVCWFYGKTSGGGTKEITGNAASGATDSGNPVKVAAKYNVTRPTFTDGQRGDLQIDARGNLSAFIRFTTNDWNSAADNADGVVVSATTNKGVVIDRGMVFNGTTWDRMRGDTNGTLVEQRFLYSRKTADGQVKASAGFIHSVTISPTTATPTAGLLTIYDNTAESGTIIYTEWVTTTDIGHTIILDVVATTGIYVGYDATLANVSCTVSYR